MIAWRKKIKAKWATLRVQLQNERKRQNLGVYKLAMSMNMSGQSLSAYEYEDTAPSMFSFLRWADALGLDVKLVKRVKKR